MKSLLLAAAAALSVVGAADARSSGGYSHHSSSYHRTSGYARESDLTTHSHYTNISGHYVHSPSRMRNGSRPPGASAQCSDGTWSFSEHARGTCSHHGGIG